jgi:cyanate lyase
MMPEKWTGRLVGKMHNYKITYDDLAQKIGVTKTYICMILNGARKPADAKTRLESAVEELIKEKKDSI